MRRKPSGDQTERPRPNGFDRARHQSDLLDEGLKETFPASDPVSVVRVVIISGSTLSSSTAARPALRARSKAGANSAVRDTTSACAPKLSAHFAKSGFFSPTE